MSKASLNAGNGSLWIQFPGQAPLFLGCHALEEISQGEGDKTLQYCVDPRGPGLFQVAGSYRGAPEPPSFSIEALTSTEADYLEKVKALRSRVTFFVNKHTSGRRDLFTNWERRTVLVGAEITSVTEGGVSARDPNNNADSLYTVEMEADEWLTIYPLDVVRQSTSEANALNGTAWLDDQVGYAVADATGGATANILYTEDGGGTWTATATDPFAVDEDVLAVAVFPMGRDSHRVIVARETDAAAPAEIAYSDNEGATWTLVTVGATNGHAPLTANGLFALDLHHVWLVTNGGYIYFSDDAAVTWEIQDAGVVVTGNLNAVHFIDSERGVAAGAAGKVLTTGDGGGSWSLVATISADPLLSAFMIDEDNIWVGNDKSAAAGTLYKTEDGGDTFENRTFSGSSAGEVKSISFYNEAIGVIAHNNATPNGLLFVTYDGGETWEGLDEPTTAALNCIRMIDANTFYAVGEAQGGTGVIVRGYNGLSPDIS